MRGRLALDFGLIVLILSALAYQLTGNRLHEAIGIGFLVAVIAHNLLSRRWYKALARGRMDLGRAVSTVLNLALAAATLLLVVSGLANARDLVSFWRSESVFLDRHVHAWAAYWVLILASVHLGMHKAMLANEALRLIGRRTFGGLGRILWRAAAVLVSGFGIYAFFERDLPFKLAGLYAFDYWDFDSSVLGFFARYGAIVGAGGLFGACLRTFLHPPRKTRRAASPPLDRHEV